MTRFKIKIKSEDCIEIWQNKECLAESDDFKEVVTYIAHLIIEDKIDKYKVITWEKGKTQELTNFDPHAIIKDNPNIKFEDDEDDEDDYEDNRRFRRGKRRRSLSHFDDEDDSESTPQRWVYQPRYTADDYSRIGKRLADELSNRND